MLTGSASYVPLLDKASHLSLISYLIKLRNIVDGLQHMHSLGVVHGDLKAVSFAHQPTIHLLMLSSKANILINDRHEACLADFGLSTVLHGSASLTGTKGTLRWMAPELISSPDPEGGVPSCASDVYALAMVFYEVRAPALRLRVEEELLIDPVRSSPVHTPSWNCEAMRP